MKILINDPISDKGAKILEEKGFELTRHHYGQEELREVIPNYDAIIVRSATKITKEVIAASSGLKVIARAGTGIDNIDHEYAESEGIKVVNAPGANSSSAAELAIAHLFALARFIPQSKITMQKGEWNKKKYKGIELAGKTIGIMGFGRIGTITAKLALGLGMTVIAHDISKSDSELNVEFKSKEEVLKEADFVVLHLPALDKPYITEKELKMMKNEAYLVNGARGMLIDDDALLKALDQGEIAGAGLDVFTNEPPQDLRLVKHEKTSVTPHIGAATKDAQERVGVMIAENLIDALEN